MLEIKRQQQIKAKCCKNIKALMKRRLRRKEACIKEAIMKLLSK
jgi:hypothetical protein